MAEDALVAIANDGEPLSIEHGGPAAAARYHMRGDPWKEVRHGW